MHRLDSNAPDFEAAFAALVRERREADSDVSGTVSEILSRVRQDGDDALAEYSATFDNYPLKGDDDWRIGRDQCEAAYNALDDDLRDALDLAASRIRAYHEGQLPENRDYTDHTGLRLGALWRPVEAAGLYVPGGRAAYPSSLLMNAIPARVAGVKRLVVTTPTPGGHLNALVMAAAHSADIDEIWRVGGAQAIGALAYGTRRIAPVDVITGPGNAFVAEAKRQLYGVVGIDMVAGPSEILVIADAANAPEVIAADLLSQAEHDPTAQSILITDNAGFAALVSDALEAQISALASAPIARESWAQHGAIITVSSLESEAPALANQLAAEHVLLAVDEPETLMRAIHNAGSVFLGRMTPEALGDYVAGPNHVLPTGRRARFSSGLSVLDFMKRTSFIGADKGVLEQLGPSAMALARAEGLPAHADSVARRLMP